MNNNELYHYGIKGMKWGRRNPARYRLRPRKYYRIVQTRSYEENNEHENPSVNAENSFVDKKRASEEKPLDMLKNRNQRGYRIFGDVTFDEKTRNRSHNATYSHKTLNQIRNRTRR